MAASQVTLYVTQRLLPSLFSIPGLIYLFNEYRDLDYKKTTTSSPSPVTTISGRRNLFLFFDRNHTYTSAPGQDAAKFTRLAEYDLRHPLARHLVRPYYVYKLSYPTVEK